MHSQFEKTPFDEIGEENVHQLVERFYELVAVHPALAPIFPDDFTETIRKQKQFLTQFLGGPPLYSEEHGHPMLRARHMPFQITEERANAWLACMSQAMADIELQEPIRSQLFERLTYTAHHMVNTKV
ncbi:globin [Evansella cellulosilytica]|uniref:Globin n=1 Tax=Evansella cellulosilytica (strain ATCC 21833 / DSM 2522 / FERM P-1141 / JCM 9156 / N-4) TaxID=649639 RepID=E6TX59_EVAC2|nr:globin [Evansella cellulosilytica]ADU31148.1 globin [Evansella cellulosilytica DSM 2522]